jgi:transposase
MIRTDSTSGLWESLFQARAKELVKQLSDPSSVKAVVADSKFYSASNAENMVLLPFITRVPETIGAVRNRIEKALSDPDEWLVHSESRDHKKLAIKKSLDSPRHRFSVFSRLQA